MIQRFASLPLALRVLILIVALGALLVVVAGIPVLTATTFERFSGFLKGGGDPQRVDTGKSAPLREDEYLGAVERIQAGSVQAHRGIDERFRRFDSLSSADVEEMKADYDALGGYLARADALDPPEGYEEQYELFRSAIADLEQAAGLAYSMASDPGSVTKPRLDQYDLLVEEAGSVLQQSNQVLGRDLETVSSRKSG